MKSNLLRDGKTVSFRNCRDTPGSFRLVQIEAGNNIWDERGKALDILDEGLSMSR